MRSAACDHTERNSCRYSAMARLARFATIMSFAYLNGALAQSATETLEPLPSDPAKRIYYGDYYDPGKYAACRRKWVAEGGDPRVATCLRFKERLPPLDPSARDHFGEFYDPQKYHDCRARARPNETQCNYLKVRRRVLPEYWPYPNVPKLELPKAPNPPIYRFWMNARQYFEALCKAEAGEFIYRTVDNVQGVYEIRPRGYAKPEALYDRYVMEDPYGYTEAEAMNTLTLFVGPGKYQFAEVPVPRERIRLKQLDGKRFDPSIFLHPSSDDVVARYFGYDDRSLKTLKKEYDTKLRSRYGYTWRGIKRPKDREHGIAGGELIVVDLKTNEILGIRRGLIRAAKSGYSHSGLTWEFGEFCPLLSKRTGIAKDYDASFTFVARVLRPRDHRRGE